jgi:hypothetical protein
MAHMEFVKKDVKKQERFVHPDNACELAYTGLGVRREMVVPNLMKRVQGPRGMGIMEIRQKVEKPICKACWQPYEDSV